MLDDASVDPASVAYRTFTGPALTDPAEFARPGFRRADIGAGNGHGTARALAQILGTVPARLFDDQPLPWGFGFN